MLYTEDENVTCYKCDQEEYNKIETKSSTFLEYIKLHRLSLIQDMEDANNDIPIQEDEYYESDAYYEGAINALEHILSVATDIMNDNERVY
jgi:hypothetical protein